MYQINAHMRENPVLIHSEMRETSPNLQVLFFCFLPDHFLSTALILSSMNCCLMLPHQPLTQIARSTFECALEAVRPDRLISNIMVLRQDPVSHGFKLLITPLPSLEGVSFLLPNSEPDIFLLDEISQILVIGGGKASQGMARGLLQVMKPLWSSQSPKSVSRITIRIMLNYPKGEALVSISEDLAPPQVSIQMYPTSHPLPDRDAWMATINQVKAIQSCQEKTLLIALFSGGGSSMFETAIEFGHDRDYVKHCCCASNHLPSSISLDDIQLVYKVMLESGAHINEINTIRKHLSTVKGGQICRYINKSPWIKNTIGLYLSDVVGGDPSTIASGPTCPDPSTYKDCLYLVKKYDWFSKFPRHVIQKLQTGAEVRTRTNHHEEVDDSLGGYEDCQLINDTPKEGNKIFDRVINVVIGSALTSVGAAQKHLHSLAFKTFVLPRSFEGDAHIFGCQLEKLVEVLFDELYDRSSSLSKESYRSYFSQLRSGCSKVALIGSGELTVKIQGDGIGGRNQEMLAYLLEMQLRVMEYGEEEEEEEEEKQRVMRRYHHQSPDKQPPRCISKLFTNNQADYVLLSCAMDGKEGNSPATGAMIDCTSTSRLIHHYGGSISGARRYVQQCLDRNDTFSIFDLLEDAIITGPTGTNVNDIMLLLIDLSPRRNKI